MQANFASLAGGHWIKSSCEVFTPHPATYVFHTFGVAINPERVNREIEDPRPDDFTQLELNTPHSLSSFTSSSSLRDDRFFLTWKGNLKPSKIARSRPTGSRLKRRSGPGRILTLNFFLIEIFTRYRAEGFVVQRFFLRHRSSVLVCTLCYYYLNTRWHEDVFYTQWRDVLESSSYRVGLFFWENIYTYAPPLVRTPFQNL